MRMRALSRVLVLGVVVLAVAGAIAAQAVQPAEPSFDVTLQLVVGSEDGGRSDLPANLGEVSKQMRSHFAFKSYQVASTFFGRIANGGSFEYRSANSLTGQSNGDARTFLEWSLGDFRTVPTTSGAQGVQGRAFRFGARVPVATGGGKEGPQITYESIGVNVGRFVVQKDVPTLIGTLNLPGTSGTVFVVMTVSSAD